MGFKCPGCPPQPVGGLIGRRRGVAAAEVIVVGSDLIGQSLPPCDITRHCSPTPRRNILRQQRADYVTAYRVDYPTEHRQCLLLYAYIYYLIYSQKRITHRNTTAMKRKKENQKYLHSSPLLPIPPMTEKENKNKNHPPRRYIP